jgi:hypothetical protein
MLDRYEMIVRTAMMLNDISLLNTMKLNTKSDCNITSWKALEKFDQLTQGLEKSCQFKHVNVLWNNIDRRERKISPHLISIGQQEVKEIKTNDHYVCDIVV